MPSQLFPFEDQEIQALRHPALPKVVVRTHVSWHWYAAGGAMVALVAMMIVGLALQRATRGRWTWNSSLCGFRCSSTKSCCVIGRQRVANETRFRWSARHSSDCFDRCARA